MTHLSPKWQLLNSCLIITRGISSFLCNRTQFITLVRTHLYYHSCFERGLKEFFAIYLHWFGLQWRKRKKRDELLDKENVKICLVVYMSSFRQVPAFYFEISCISHHCIFITIPQLVQLVFIIGSCLICDRLPPAHHGNTLFPDASPWRPTQFFLGTVHPPHCSQRKRADHLDCCHRGPVCTTCQATLLSYTHTYAWLQRGEGERETSCG